MIGAEVQKAIFDALKAAPAIAGGNVFDVVPGTANGQPGPFPRVTIGRETIDDDSNSCDDGWIVYSTVETWSRSVGYPEAKTLGAQVVERIKAITTIPGFTLIDVRLERDDRFRDQDGLTSRSRTDFRFIINPA